MLLYVSYKPYSSHLACYVRVCSLLKINATFLRRCCSILKHKQHTLGTFDQIKLAAGQTISPNLKGLKCLFRFKYFKSKKCKNKLSLKQGNTLIITKQEVLFNCSWLNIHQIIISLQNKMDMLHCVLNKYKKQNPVSCISPL